MITATFYKVTNKLNGKSYIGATTMKPGKRWSSHKTMARIKGSTSLHRAMARDGVDNFEFQEIETKKLNSKSEMYDLEIELIKKNGTFGNGYNETIGGAGKLGYKDKPETIIKKSLASRGVPCPWKPGRVHHMLGKRHSEISVRKISESKKGQYIAGDTKSAEWTLNQSKAQDRSYTVHNVITGESFVIKGLKKFLDQESIPWSTGAMAVDKGGVVRGKYVFTRNGPKKGERVSV